MNLITTYFENSFEIKSKTINTLVIEDTKIFTNFLLSLFAAKNKQSTEIELMEDLQELDIAKTTEIIFDLFHLKADSESILKKLYKEIEDDFNSEEMYTKKLVLESTIADIMDDLTYRSRFSLKSSELNYLNLFKAVSLEFDYDKTSVLDSLLEYIRATSELLNKKLFIIVNLDSFLNAEELIELHKFLQYNEIKVLVLQNRIIRNVGASENLRIIDEDLCEI